jgi:hypothetical protein
VSERGLPDLRVGDAEREAALKALGEHMSVGRLNVDEYGERAAQVTAAKTRGDLTQLFADLPQPHPVLDKLPDTADQDRAPIRSEQQAAVARRRRQRSAMESRLGPLVPLSLIVSIVLLISVPALNWTILLLPAAMAMLVAIVLGRAGRR